VLGGVTLALAPAASADGIEHPGDPSCADLVPGTTEIMFVDPKWGMQHKTVDGVPASLSMKALLADDPYHDGDQTGNDVIDFTVAGGRALGVILKGGSTSNFYDYRPDGTHGFLHLHTPVDESTGKFYAVTQVRICVTKLTPTPEPTPTPSHSPSVTPSDTPSGTPSETPSATPSETPSETPSATPSESPSGTPSETPSESPSGSPSESPSSTPSATPSGSPASTPAPVPTEVDAGQSGGLRNMSAITTHQSAWGAALLTLGAVLVFASIVKSRQKRGQHSA
jgi:hypothetical protein